MSSVENLLTKIEGVSHLVQHDADLFMSFFKKERTCYANSWLYTLRSTRNDLGQLGFKFLKQDVLLGIGYRNKFIYLTHPLGKNKFPVVQKLCSDIAALFDYPIVLKKLDEYLYLQLEATKYFSASARSEVQFEDEVFPEKVLNLYNMFDSEFRLYPKFLALGKKIRRFEQLDTQLTTKSYFTYKEVEYAKSSSLFNPEKYFSYYPMIQQVISSEFDETRYKVCAFHDSTNKLQGLYIGELLGKDQMGLYCSLTSRALPGITEYMDFQFLKYLFSNGIKTVYLGGSETEGVFNYVKKLLPDRPHYLMLPLVYQSSM